MADIRQITNDPDFQALPISEQVKGLSEMDPGFAGLPASEQVKGLKELQSIPAKLDIYPAKIEGNIATGKIPQEGGTFIKGTELRQDYPIRRSIMGVVRPVLENTGLIGGGLVGTGAGFMGGGVMAPVGGVVGAGLGYGIGTTLSDILEEQMGIRRPTSYGDTALGRLHKSGLDIGTGAMLEAGGQAVGKFISGIGKNKIDLNPNAQYAMGIAKKRDVPFSPADYSLAKGDALVENVLINSPGSATLSAKEKLKTIIKLTEERDNILAQGGSPSMADAIGRRVKNELDSYVSDVGIAKQEGIDQIKTDILGKLGSTDSYESLSLSTKDILAQRSMEAMQKKNALYQEAAALIPPDKFSTNNLSAKADELLKTVISTPNPDSKLVNTLRWASSTERKVPADLLEDVNFLRLSPNAQETILTSMGFSPEDMMGGLVPKQKDMATLLRFRSELNKSIAAEDLAIKNGNPAFKGQLSPEGQVLKTLKSSLDKDLETMAADTGGEAWQTYQAANKFYGEDYAPIWKNKSVQKMAYSDPNSLLKIAFRPNNVPEINTVRKAVGEEGFDALKRKFTQQLFDKAPDLATAEKAFNGLGESVNAIYSPAELKLLKDSYTTGIRLEGSQLVDKKLLNIIKSLDGYPELVVQKLIRPNNTETIRRVMPFLSPQTRKDVEYEFLAQLMQTNKPTANSMASKLLGPEYAYISPAKFETNYNNYGDKTIKSALSPENYIRVKELLSITRYANTAERIAGNPSGTAQNVISYTTLGMFFHNPVMGTAMYLTPKMFAKFYFSPTGFKLFTQGIKTPALIPKGVELSYKVLGVMNEIKNKNPQFEETGGTE